MTPTKSLSRKFLSAPEKFVIVVLLTFGGIASLATPLSAGYDEETHFVRAWEMAHLYFIPNEQLGARLPFPALYWELSYRRQPLYDAVEPGFWSKYGGLPIDAHDYIYANVETRSVYSPLLLLPQALALRYLGLSLQLPALPVYYACRLVGLLCYLLLSWLAVRLIPYGKWLLAILIVSPMAVFQASTISADSISNGIGFFFVAASLAIAGRKTIGWKEWAALLGCVALLFTAKVNLLFLAALPFLLISPRNFKMKYGFALLAGVSLALALAEVGGWNMLAYSKFTRALAGADPRAQLLFIAANPFLFVRIIARDVWSNTLAYMQGWVGVYGYNYWPVPALTYLLYPLAVVAATRRGDAEDHLLAASATLDKRTRIILVSLFGAGYVLTIASLYVAFTPVQSLLVAGVQGRYFTVVMPLLFIGLLGPGSDRAVRDGRSGAASQATAAGITSEPRVAANVHIATSISILLALSSLILYVGGLVLSYRVTCGSEYYRSGLCYQPQYKNWAPQTDSSRPVSPNLALTQEIVPACNGMTELSVWVNSQGTDPNGMTELTLRAPTQQKDVVQQMIKNAGVSPSAWLTVHFKPEWKSRDQLYVLALRGSSPGGIQVGYSEKPEYLKGRLYENEAALGQDMLFQYGCIAGLQELWPTPR
jgi:uncharacterized membrane protein